MYVIKTDGAKEYAGLISAEQIAAGAVTMAKLDQEVIDALSAGSLPAGTANKMLRHDGLGWKTSTHMTLEPSRAVIGGDAVYTASDLAIRANHSSGLAPAIGVDVVSEGPSVPGMAIVRSGAGVAGNGMLYVGSITKPAAYLVSSGNTPLFVRGSADYDLITCRRLGNQDIPAKIHGDGTLRSAPLAGADNALLFANQSGDITKNLSIAQAATDGHISTPLNCSGYIIVSVNALGSFGIPYYPIS